MALSSFHSIAHGPLTLFLSAQGLCGNGDDEKMNPSLLENASLLGDRWLAEEASERNPLSYKFIHIYFMLPSN
jgi:hypothetical protein